MARGSPVVWPPLLVLALITIRLFDRKRLTGIRDREEGGERKEFREKKGKRTSTKIRVIRGSVDCMRRIESNKKDKLFSSRLSLLIIFFCYVILLSLYLDDEAFCPLYFPGYLDSDLPTEPEVDFLKRKTMRDEDVENEGTFDRFNKHFQFP